MRACAWYATPLTHSRAPVLFRPLLGRNGEGKVVVDSTRDGMATITSLAGAAIREGEASPTTVHPNEPAPRYAREPPAPLPYASVKDDVARSKDERMATQLLASGFSAAEAQRMMRRAQATGGRCGAVGAVERAAGWGRSTVPIVRTAVGKKNFTDMVYENHLETHLSMPGLKLVQRRVAESRHAPPLATPLPARGPSPRVAPSSRVGPLCLGAAVREFWLRQRPAAPSR